jgi:hypothetical protein
VPAPSQETVDSIFQKYAGVIVGSVVALASTIVGAVLVVVAGRREGESAPHSTD